MLELLLSILQPIVLLFIVLDPLANAPFFFVLTKDFSDEERKGLINESVVAATIILLLFAIAGDLLMSALGITVGDFKVAAGLVLLIYSVLGLLEVRLLPKSEKRTIAIVPMATPLLAGPGSIATVIYIKYSWGLHIAIFTIVVNALIALPVLQAGGKLRAMLGENGTLILDKVMSLILAAFAIAIIRSGITEIMGMMMSYSKGG